MEKDCDASTALPNACLEPAMKRLTSIEWAHAKEPISHLSLANRAVDQKQQRILWLDARAGSGWYYVSGDNYHFGSPADATAFRQWLSAVPSI